MSYSPEPYTRNKNKTKIELDLSNYATKSDLKNATGVDTAKLAENAAFSNLKSNIDKLDIDKSKNVPSGLNTLKSKADGLGTDKLETTPLDLSGLSDVVKTKVLKILYIMNGLKKLMPLILVGLFKKQIMILRPTRLKLKYLVLLA